MHGELVLLGQFLFNFKALLLCLSFASKSDKYTCFWQSQMNDASEVLAVIFNCLHQSSTSSSGERETESEGSNCMGNWDCASNTCIAHTLFGMDIYEQMNCYSCGVESRHLKYTSFFHNINANALRTMKVLLYYLFMHCLVV